MTTPAQEKQYWDNGAASYDSDLFTVENYTLLKEYLPQGEVLEIGCGTGNLTTLLANSKNYTVHGIDISRKMLQLAPNNKVQYVLNDGRTIPYQDNYFGGIYSVTVFQHIPKEAKIGYIKESARTLKTGGVLLIQFVEGTYHGDFDHNATTNEMRQWLLEVGFKITNILHSSVHPQWTWIRGKL